MFDVNPLGPLMHLKELERQAISMTHRKPGEGRSNIGAFGEWLAISLRRILASHNGIAKKSKA